MFQQYEIKLIKNFKIIISIFFTFESRIKLPLSSLIFQNINYTIFELMYLALIQIMNSKSLKWSLRSIEERKLLVNEIRDTLNNISGT